MRAALRVTKEMLASVRDFVQSQDIPLDVVSDGRSEVRAVRSETDEREESDVATLKAGGWIACPTALAMAPRLDITAEQLGALLDFLNIKVRACSLGCFK